MKNEPLFKYVAAAGAATLVLALTGAANTPAAREVTRTGTYATSRGGSGTTSSVSTRSDGLVTRQGSWVNAAGGKGKWQSEAAWDAETKAATITGSATRPDGAKTSWRITSVRTAPGVLAEKGVLTRADGKQSTFTATRTKVAPGSLDKEETITRADGATIKRSVNTTVADGKGTRIVKAVMPDGRTLTRTVNFTQASATADSPAPAS